jgi:heme/copper-type cytochrome/quinol oxidase subunit 2
MTKKKAPAMQRKQQAEQANKKAIIWTASIFVGIVILVTVLLILNQ